MNEQYEKPGPFPFVIAGLSFIPLIGVFFGLIAVIWGIIKNKSGGKKIAFIGAGGILFTVVLYSALFYFGFVQRGGIYDKLRAKLSGANITSLVQSIEFYKTQNGQYPESLEVLQKSLPKNSFVFIFDPADIKLGGSSRHYYYELVDNDHYYLLGIGPDGKPFTEDDILPQVEVGEQSRVGLLIKPR